jgi:hypothetical protein
VQPATAATVASPGSRIDDFEVTAHLVVSMLGDTSHDQR